MCRPAAGDARPWVNITAWAYFAGYSPTWQPAAPPAVSHSAVIKIVRQFVETDVLDPQKVGGSRKPFLIKCYDMVRAIVDETPDLTLAQIADEIVARGGPKVGKSTVDRTLTRLDLKFKKKV